MVTVVSVNKNGNKIMSYTCKSGGKTKNLSKAELIDLINAKQVTNARIQIYKGNTIIRLSNSDTIHNTKEVAQCESSAETLLGYINKAKKAGIKELDLSNIIVNTSTLEIIKKASDRIAQANKIEDNTKTSKRIEEFIKNNITDTVNQYVEIDGDIYLLTDYRKRLAVINMSTGKYTKISTPDNCEDMYLSKFNNKINIIASYKKSGYIDGSKFGVALYEVNNECKSLALVSTSFGEYPKKFSHVVQYISINERYKFITTGTSSDCYIYDIVIADLAESKLHHVKLYHTFDNDRCEITWFENRYSATEIDRDGVTLFDISENENFTQIKLRFHFKSRKNKTRANVSFSVRLKNYNTEDIYNRFVLYNDDRDSVVYRVLSDGTEEIL